MRCVGRPGRPVQSERSSSEAVLLLGSALLRRGKAQEANEALTAAVRMHPNDATLRCLLGRSYDVVGQPDQAKECYKAALKIDENNVIARQLLSQAAR